MICCAALGSRRSARTSASEKWACRITRAPAAASSSAMAAPTRRAAPVTSAVLPVSCIRAIVWTVRDFLKAVGGGAKTSRALTRDQARQAMTLIAEGKCAPEQLGAFLMALRMKGETADELAGFVEALEEKMDRVPAP